MMVRDCGFKETNYPPHSSDLNPVNLLLNLKKVLRGEQFSNNEVLKAAINAYFAEKEEKYFDKGY